VIFLDFFWNSLEILREFYQNSSGISMEILSEFFGDVWLGVLNVWVLILGDKEVRFDLMTGQQKTITRSVELECSRLKTSMCRYFQFLR
jgi:hypothetical protein